MNLTFSKAYLISLKLQKQIAERAQKKQIKKTVIGTLTYSNSSLLETEDFVPSVFTVVSCDTFEGLSKRAMLLTCKILSDLKENNALWIFDQTKNRRDTMVIAELRKKEILFKTETTDIHYVNPLFLRRGTPAGVVFNMIHLLQDSSKVVPEMVRSLRTRSKGDVNPIDAAAV